MTAYLALQIDRDILAAEIRHALAHDRSALPRLYLKAKRLALASLAMEMGR